MSCSPVHWEKNYISKSVVLQLSIKILGWAAPVYVELSVFKHRTLLGHHVVLLSSLLFPPPPLPPPNPQTLPKQQNQPTNKKKKRATKTPNKTQNKQTPPKQATTLQQDSLKLSSY